MWIVDETLSEMSARLDREFSALMASATVGRGDGLSELRRELEERGDFEWLSDVCVDEEVL